jgi:hypothetical protein
MRNRSFYLSITSLYLAMLMLVACGNDPTEPAAHDSTATAAISETSAAIPPPPVTSKPNPSPTSTPKPKPTATSTPKPTPTSTPKPSPTAGSPSSGSAAPAPAAPAVTGGKYYFEIETIRKDSLKKLDAMNDALAELRAQVINSEWDKAKESWKTAHLAFLTAQTLTPQLLINDLYGNMDAQLDERPSYGFQVLEGIIYDKKPTKELALPVAARLVRDGRQARNLIDKAEIDALMIFRGMRNICGGMAAFLGEEGPNSLSQTSVIGTRAKLQALKDSYAVFSPTVERLGPETNKKVMTEIKNVETLLAGSSPDPHTVDLAAKKILATIDEAGDVLRVDPLLEGPELLNELGNERIALDGAISAIYQDNLDLLSEQFTEFEVGWEGKVGRSVREVDAVDFDAIDSLRRSINEALYFNVTPDKDLAKQGLIDLAKAVDKAIANIRKIPVNKQP